MKYKLKPKWADEVEAWMWDGTVETAAILRQEGIAMEYDTLKTASDGVEHESNFIAKAYIHIEGEPNRRELPMHYFIMRSPGEIISVVSPGQFKEHYEVMSDE